MQSHDICKCVKGQSQASARVQIKTLHDRLSKLLVLGFEADIGPAQLTDYVILLRSVGSEVSGLSSSVTDQTDSTQNNRRAGEFASFKVVHALLTHVPQSGGSALFSLVTAAYLAAWKDAEGFPPMLPQTRVAHLAFVHCFLTFHTIAIISGHIEIDGQRVSQYQHTVRMHGFASQTRQALCLGLPGMLVLLQGQREDCKPGRACPPVVPQTCGSQDCESTFGVVRDPNSRTCCTGPTSAGRAHSSWPTA